AQRLRPVADQRHLDPAHPNGGAVAQWHLGRAKALPAVGLDPNHLDVRIDRRAGAGADLAAEAERKLGAGPGIETKPHRDRIPDWPNRSILHVALDETAEDRRIVGRRAATGVVR